MGDNETLINRGREKKGNGQSAKKNTRHLPVDMGFERVKKTRENAGRERLVHTCARLSGGALAKPTFGGGVKTNLTAA